MTESFDVAVIGGGAAGMMCAAEIRRLAPARSVVLLERQARAGRKLLATGNGRCNLTNMNIAPEFYPGGADFARAALMRCPPSRVLEAFERMGLVCASDEAGRVYPRSDQAASVLDALRLTLTERGAQLYTGFEVNRLERGFMIGAVDGRRLRAARVVLSTGGPAGAKLGGTSAGHHLMKALGHPTTRCLPALVQIKTDPEPVRALKGIRAACRLQLIAGGRAIERAAGEVLFQEYGVSGIAAMALGRAAAQAMARGERTILQIALADEDMHEVRARLEALRRFVPARALEDFLSGLVPKRIGQTLIKQAGIGPLLRASGSLSDEELDRLVLLLTDWRLSVIGTRGFEDAQVTAGGLSTEHFCPDTLESRIVPGLYAAGEVLDVDGTCGGYNLHWAWASALAAAEASSR
ncbi:aminoacetone oxidase family FAD-binding enzyme [Bacillota bacterium Meth-B3]